MFSHIKRHQNQKIKRNVLIISFSSGFHTNHMFLRYLTHMNIQSLFINEAVYVCISTIDHHIIIRENHDRSTKSVFPNEMRTRPRSRERHVRDIEILVWHSELVFSFLLPFVLFLLFHSPAVRLVVRDPRGEKTMPIRPEPLSFRSSTESLCTLVSFLSWPLLFIVSGVAVVLSFSLLSSFILASSPFSPPALIEFFCMPLLLPRLVSSRTVSRVSCNGTMQLGDALWISLSRHPANTDANVAEMANLHRRDGWLRRRHQVCRNIVV